MSTWTPRGKGRRRLQASFRRASICAFRRLGFRQSGFRHIARAARPAAPYAWARPAGFLACYGPSFLTDPGKPSGPRTPPPVRARYAGDTGSAPRGAPMSSMLSAPAAIPATRHGTFRCALTPHSAARTGRAPRPARQPGALRQGHHRDQPGVRHEIRVIERCVRPREAMQQSHLQGVLSNRVEASATPIVPGQRAPFALTRPSSPLFTGGSRLRPARRTPGRASQGRQIKMAQTNTGQVRRGPSSSLPIVQFAVIASRTRPGRRF